VPSFAKADHPKPFAHIFLEPAQRLAESPILLGHTPEFERVVELVYLGYPDPLPINVV
jgi:hypothetical protein